jgi:hypothetical protein
MRQVGQTTVTTLRHTAEMSMSSGIPMLAILTSSHHGAWMLACVPMTLRTLLGIEHPIIQAPMAGFRVAQ